MFRSFFVYLSKAVWARQIVTAWPVAWRMASRFVAGDTLQQAIEAIRVLNAKNINATLDHLGENTTNSVESHQATQDILEALGAIQTSGVRANVSIKLTQIGLRLDQALCVENLSRILQFATDLNNFVRIDMEDSSTTQATLDMLNQMRQRGFRNLGIVVQSYLYRTQADVQALARDGVPVRMCKGAYKEPATVAFPRKRDVDGNYDRLAAFLLDSVSRANGLLLSADGKSPPFVALATHDLARIEFARQYANKLELPQNAVEFQMLYGIRRNLQEGLVGEGYPVRVYVPYGTQWYPYLMRRLGERPANMWFIVSNFFRR